MPAGFPSRDFLSIGDADSVVVDPHKGLFLPYGTGGLVVRDRTRLREAFQGRGEYMTATASDLVTLAVLAAGSARERTRATV